MLQKVQSFLFFIIFPVILFAQHEPNSGNKLEFVKFEKTDNYARIVCLEKSSGEKVNLYSNFPFADAVNLQIRSQEFVPVTDSTIFPFDSQENDQDIILTKGDIKVKIRKTPLVIQVTRKNELIFSTHGGIEYSNSENEKKICFTNTMDSDEHVYGFGEKFNGLDQRGNKVVMEISDAYMKTNGDTYKSIPFFLSSKRYGVLVNTTLPVVFHMGDEKNDRYSVEIPDSEMDVVLYCNTDPLKIIEQNTEITGRSPIIPGWALGTWLSRRGMTGWNNTAYTEADIDMLVREKYPLGIILWEGVRGQFNIDQSPSMNELVDKWHGLEIKTVFWGPTGQIDMRSSIIKETKPEYFVRRADSSFAIGGVRMNSVYLDVTNPEAMDWWKETLYAHYLTGQGDRSVPEHKNLDGIKIDFSEMFPKDYDLKLLYKPVKGMTNLHAVMFGKEIYNWIQSIKPDGGIIWIRGGGLGLQTSGYCWGGDRGRTFPQLQGTVDASLAISICGVGLIGHDIAGYRGGFDKYDREVYIRGVQYSTFGPSFHDHGSAPAPWEQDEYGWQNYKFYARVRYNLLPYLYHYVKVGHETGAPLMRTLYLHYPDDTKTFEINDEYMLGDEMLVAPILEPGFSRNIYLPAGEWIDFWTQERFAGKQEIEFTGPLNRIPVYIKSNTILPLALNNTMNVGGAFEQVDKNDLLLSFLLFGCTDARFELQREDNTVGVNAKQNVDDMDININNPKQDFGLVCFGKKPESVSVNDKKITLLDLKSFESCESGWMYDNKKHFIKIRVAHRAGVADYKININGGQSVAAVNAIKPNVSSGRALYKPNIETIEAWDKQLVINIKPLDSANGYKMLWGTDWANLDNEIQLGTVDKVFLNGLKNGEPVYVILTTLNEWGESKEVDAGPISPTSDRKPLFSFGKDKEMFIYGGQTIKRISVAEDTSELVFAVEAKTDLNCNLWIKARKNIAHHQYYRWYSMGEIDMKSGVNYIDLKVQGKDIEVEKIYLTSDKSERPLLKDEKAGDFTDKIKPADHHIQVVF